MPRLSRTIATATDDYDWQDDHRKNIEFAYVFIRERVASGGKGWKGYAMWQPIASAPKDTEVLVYGPYGYHVAYLDGLTTLWMGDDGEISIPTHWQVLPEPPK